MGSFSKHVVDKYLAPHVSSFTSATIPDRSGDSTCWLDNHFLNSVLRKPYKDGARPLVFNYLRRVEAAFGAHAEAREATERFLAGSRQSLSTYMSSLLHWETFLAQSWMAYALLVRLFKVQAFKKGDGSTEQRLNALYNRTKHADSAIAAGQIPPDGTTVAWLSNEGLKTEHDELSWGETGEVLDDLAKWAGILEDPLTAGDKIRALP